MFAQVSNIQNHLEKPPHNVPTVVFSLDDLYLTHAEQVNLATQNANNPLLQHRGQPSTHDIRLAKTVFSSLSRNAPTAIPQYNKAALNGQGDRTTRDHWQTVNVEGQNTIRVVIFEGWAVGFRPLSDVDLKQRFNYAVSARQAGDYVGRLGHSTLDSVAHINRALKDYDEITE